MIPLNDSRWAVFDGGYRIPYDASIPLTQLETAATEEEIKAVFTELWNELHHQGDVGLASYFSVPHLIRIAKEKKLFDYNVPGLVTTIEIERHNDNPKLPGEFEEAYLFSIHNELPDLVSQMMKTGWDTTLTATALAALAVSKGHIQMADAILKLEDQSTLHEFLENY